MRKRLLIAFCTPEFLNLDIFGAKQFTDCMEPLCTFIGEIRDTKVNATLLQIVFRLLRLLFTRLLEASGNWIINTVSDLLTEWVAAHA